MVAARFNGKQWHAVSYFRLLGRLALLPVVASFNEMDDAFGGKRWHTVAH